MWNNPVAIMADLNPAKRTAGLSIESFLAGFFWGGQFTLVIPIYFKGKTMVACRCALDPIQLLIDLVCERDYNYPMIDPRWASRPLKGWCSRQWNGFKGKSTRNHVFVYVFLNGFDLQNVALSCICSLHPGPSSGIVSCFIFNIFNASLGLRSSWNP